MADSTKDERSAHNRRDFLIRFSMLSGGTLVFGTFGCGSRNSNRSNGAPKTLGTAEQGLGVASLTPGNVDKLKKDLASSKKTVEIPTGIYVIDCNQSQPDVLSTSLTKCGLVSNVEARKLTGVGPRGSIIIRFINVPDNFVCLDFRDKSRIRNISFEVIPSNSNPQRIAMIRFRKVITEEFETVGTFEMINPRMNIIKNIENNTANGTKTIKFTDANNTKHKIEINKNAFKIDDSPSHQGGQILKDKPKVLVIQFRSTTSPHIDRPVVWKFAKNDPTNDSSWTFLPFISGDEADADSSATDCTFKAFAAGGGPLTGSKKSGVTAIVYVGRNISCKGNEFFDLGTAVNLSFPATRDLSDVLSRFVRNQSGFYGHRKGRFYKNKFTDVSRFLHLTGPVTARALSLTETEGTGGQLLYCDGDGGLRGSLISQNRVAGHHSKDAGYASTILFDRGVFEDNLIVKNTFSGTANQFINISASRCSGNVVAENQFWGSSVDALWFRTTDNTITSLLVALNTFKPNGDTVLKTVTSPVIAPINLMKIELKQNINISMNSSDFSTVTKSKIKRYFVSFPTTGTDRVLILRNTVSAELQPLASGQPLGTNSIIQGVK